MEGRKRLSVGLAGAGLLAALAIALVGRGTPPAGTDIDGVAAEVDGLIREAAAGVQARADTLAQLPRLGWAVATDEETVRDMTTEELAFRTKPGEHIEIANMPKAGGAVRQLLRLPPDASFAMPMSPGSRLFIDGGKSHVAAIVSVEPRQRADELTGLLAVSRLLDTAALEQRLDARGIHAELRIGEASVTLGVPTPPANGTQAKTALASPTAAGAELVVVWQAPRPAWTRFAPWAVALLSLLVATLLWRRKSDQERIAPAGAPAHSISPPQVYNPAAASWTDPGKAARVHTEAEVEAELDAEVEWTDPAKTDPVVNALPPAPLDGPVPEPEPPGAVPIQSPFPAQLPPPFPTEPRRRVNTGAVDLRLDQSRSGRVDISLTRSGSVSFGGERREGPKRASTPMLGNENDPRNEEYKALYTEFVRLRRTTGEPIENLDVVDFVEVLQEKRAQLIRDLGVQDVRFRLAFDNGKAAIRYMTVAAAKSS